MSGRERKLHIQFRVTPQEKAAIRQKMYDIGTKNTEAYLRKMAIDGEVVKLDTTDIKELVRLLRVTSNSLNQLAKRANETGNVYSEDIEDLRKSYHKLWGMAEEIMVRLASV